MSIIFKDIGEQRSYIWKYLNKIYPNFKTGGFYYRQYLKDNISHKVVLDAGCGRGGMISEFESLPKLIIGIDKDSFLINDNKVVNKKIIADLENIPLENCSVDIITAEFVLEHLKNPEGVLAELSRVLKPNGLLIFITPNILNPVIFISKILPYSFHKFLRQRLLKKKETHKTFYYANRYGQLLKLAEMAKLRYCEISRVGNPEYMAFCKPLVLPSIIFEKMIDNRFLDFFKMYLVGYFIKL